MLLFRIIVYYYKTRKYIMFDPNDRQWTHIYGSVITLHD